MRGYNRTRHPRTIPFAHRLTREYCGIERSEGAQKYQTSYNHAFPLHRRNRKESSYTREGGCTTVSDAVGPYPPLRRQHERIQQYQEGGREGTQQCQTSSDHNLSSTVETRQYSSIKRNGGGTTVPDPVGPYPPLHGQNETIQTSHEGGRGHNSTRPRRTIPSVLPSNERIPPHGGGIERHKGTRPRRMMRFP